MDEDWKILLPRIARSMYNTHMGDEWDDMLYGVEIAHWLHTAAAGVKEMHAIMEDWGEDWGKDWEKELEKELERSLQLL